MKSNLKSHHAGDKRILCLPMVYNIPMGREGWRKTTCPVCGRECWITPRHAETLKKEPKIKSACTECALRSVFR